MPTKRSRAMRHRHEYPPAIQALLRGEEPEDSEEARGHLIAVYYLHRYDELGEEIVERAGGMLADWREKREGS